MKLPFLLVALKHSFLFYSPPFWLFRDPLSLRPLICMYVCMYFLLFRAALAAYGGPQARGPIGAIAAGLHHSHSNIRSEPRLRPTSQLTAMLDP